MGQYFILANMDKKECIRGRMPLKLGEIAVDREIGILAYLLATDNPDGAIKKVKKKSEIAEDDEVICEIGNVVWVIPPLKYFGRWCGDRIALVGDYAEHSSNYDGPDYDEIVRDYTDISEEAFKEFTELFGT